MVVAFTLIPGVRESHCSRRFLRGPMIRSARLSRTLVFLALLDLHLQRADAAGGVTGDEGAGEALIVCADGSYAIPGKATVFSQTLR